MSKLPQLNLRIPSEHHELVRQIAERLRESSASAGSATSRLTAWGCWAA